MKVGDRVVCINNDIGYNFKVKLTIGKIYTIIGIRQYDTYNNKYSYVVKNDNSRKYNYNSEIFLELSKFRKNIIDDILE